MTLICETVTATSMAELRRARDVAASADIVELRLDGVVDLDVAGALQGRRLPVIATCRPMWEGGRFAGSEEERLGILRTAIDLGAEYVDVEWRADRRSLPKGDRTRLVLSHHDFSGVPSDADARLKAMRRDAPSSVVKLSVAARAARDSVTLRDLARGDEGDHVVIGMGAAGIITRVCPWFFGSAWTYGGSAAPGQTPVSDLAHAYRVRSGSAARRVFALTGAPLGHSASPAMHNAAMAALDLDAVYVPIEAMTGREFLDVAEAFAIEGASVTAPLKTAWAEFGVTLDPEAKSIGAANTLGRRDGRWHGLNFDAAAFLAPLIARDVPLQGARCVVLGAGGAARAAAWALKRAGARVEVAARRTSAAASLAGALGVAASATWPPQEDWTLLVNATPVGTWPDTAASPIPRDAVRGGFVYDLVYHPRQTTLLAWAREQGAQVCGGLDMLVGQACRQFEYWFQSAAPGEVMAAAATRFLDETQARMQ